MEKIFNNTQNKTLETHTAQTIVSSTVESEMKVNKNRITKTDKRSDNRRIEESEEDQSTFKLPTPAPRKSIRNTILTTTENKQNETQAERHNNQSRENNNLSDEDRQDDEIQAMRASLFPFGMVLTPFQIMLNIIYQK